MQSRIRRGDLVTLRVPGSPLDGTEAQVDHVEDWGCHVYAPAAATKRYRAAWGELEAREGAVVANGSHRPGAVDSGFDPVAHDQGFTGNTCMKCGGSRLRRTGSCETCTDCGEGGCS